jgi:sugar lactone lactonase YvrE
MFRRAKPILAAAVRAPALAVVILSPAAGRPPGGPTVTVLASGLAGGSGCTVGPDGALYVTEWEVGRVSRVDPRTGRVTTFAEGLPPGLPFIPYSGAIDVAFRGNTAYVLVTLVAPDVGGAHVVGVYRVDGRDRFTVVADLGAWSEANPPDTAFEVPTGAQYAIEAYRGDFLVTDAHHNRVLRVDVCGGIEEVATYPNVSPTGLAIRGNTIYVGEAGPVPHLAADGRVSAFDRRNPPATIAAGVPLVVDVKFGRGNALFALAQGPWAGTFPGDPSLPDGGSLCRVNPNGTFTPVVTGLDRPTMLEFVKNTAYVITLAGDVLRIDGLTR